MQKSESRVIPLDASTRRQVLELAREHDQKLKDLQQDLFRAETKLTVERRWRWFDRGVCLLLGFIGAAVLWQQGVAVELGTSLRQGLADLLTYLSRTLVIWGLPIPLNALVFAGAVMLLALVLAAILSLRPSPQRAARELMRRVDKDPAVTGFVFRDGTFPQSSYDHMRDEAGRDEIEFPPPTLEIQMHNILHPARRTLQ